MNVTAEQRRVASLLGIQNIDSQNDLNQINRALAGSKAAGVNRIDSANDLRMIEDYYSQGSSYESERSDYESKLGQQESYYQDMLEKLKIQSAQQESDFKNRLKIMQEGFDTAQRTTLGNQTRGTQSADLKLNSASQSRLPGSFGFRRRGGGASKPFSVIGFTAPNTVQNKGATLNV
jgi:hypothetical protein